MLKKKILLAKCKRTGHGSHETVTRKPVYLFLNDLWVKEDYKLETVLN